MSITKAACRQDCEAATGAGLPQISQEAAGRILVESGKHLDQFLVAEVSVNGLGEHLAKIGGYSQVPPFIKLLGTHSRPFSVHFTALDRAAQHKHDVGVAVVGSPIA